VPIEAYVVGDTPHVGVTDVVDPSLQAAVAAYVPLPLSFTDDGPETDSEDSVGLVVTMGTVHEYAGDSPDFSPVPSSTSPVK